MSFVPCSWICQCEWEFTYSNVLLLSYIRRLTPNQPHINLNTHTQVVHADNGTFSYLRVERMTRFRLLSVLLKLQSVAFQWLVVFKGVKGKFKSTVSKYKGSTVTLAPSSPTSSHVILTVLKSKGFHMSNLFLCFLHIFYKGYTWSLRDPWLLVAYCCSHTYCPQQPWRGCCWESAE